MTEQNEFKIILPKCKNCGAENPKIIYEDFYFCDADCLDDFFLMLDDIINGPEVG